MTTQSLIAEQEELAALNKAVDEAIARRTQWLDAKMLAYSELKPGDKIYDLDSGACLGVVTGLYRYWARHDPLKDTSYYCAYTYEDSPGSEHNTSSQPGRSFGTHEQAISRAKARLERISRGA